MTQKDEKKKKKQTGGEHSMYQLGKHKQARHYRNEVIYIYSFDN